MRFCVVGLGGRWCVTRVVCIILHTQDQLLLALYRFCDTYNVFEHLETGIEAVARPVVLGINCFEVGIQRWKRISLRR